MGGWFRALSEGRSMIGLMSCEQVGQVQQRTFFSLGYSKPSALSSDGREAHGAHLTWEIYHPDLAVFLSVNTGWLPKDHRFHPGTRGVQRGWDELGDFVGEASGYHVGYDSVVQFYEGQEASPRPQMLTDRVYFSDYSYIQARDLFQGLCTEGIEWLWADLTSRWEARREAQAQVLADIARFS